MTNTELAGAPFSLTTQKQQRKGKDTDSPLFLRIVNATEIYYFRIWLHQLIPPDKYPDVCFGVGISFVGACNLMSRVKTFLEDIVDMGCMIWIADS